MAQTFNTGSRGGNLHKDGIYQVQIVDAEVKTAQSSGNTQVKLQLAVLKNGGQSGGIFMDYLTMTDNAIWRWNQLMDALDAPSDVDIDPETWLPGKVVYARLETREWDDEDRNSVKAYLSDAKAAKQIAKEGGDISAPMANDSGAKANARNRTKSNAPELSSEERMPL